VEADIPDRLGYDLPGTYFMAHKLAVECPPPFYACSCHNDENPSIMGFD
jgi:hypothetical protein